MKAIICIDPSSTDNNGVAIYIGEQRYFDTLSPVKVVELIINCCFHYDSLEFKGEGVDIDAVEFRIYDDNAISAVYANKLNPKQSLATKLKIAQSVGMVKAASKLYIDMVKHLAERTTIPVSLITFQNSHRKLDAKEFNAYTKCTIRTNQHERDAAMMYFYHGKKVL